MKFVEAVVAQGFNCIAAWNCGFDPSSKKCMIRFINIYIINIFISGTGTNTKILVKSGERNVLTLGTLCLPCYMRDTA